jgi:hypothetical protein
MTSTRINPHKRYQYIAKLELNNKENIHTFSHNPTTRPDLLDRPKRSYVDNEPLNNSHQRDSFINTMNPAQRYQTGYHFKLRESLKQNERNMHYLRQHYNAMQGK